MTRFIIYKTIVKSEIRIISEQRYYKILSSSIRYLDTQKILGNFYYFLAHFLPNIFQINCLNKNDKI